MDSSTKLSPSSARVISEKRLSWPLLGDGLPMRDVDIEFTLSRSLWACSQCQERFHPMTNCRRVDWAEVPAIETARMIRGGHPDYSWGHRKAAEVPRFKRLTFGVFG